MEGPLRRLTPAPDGSASLSDFEKLSSRDVSRETVTQVWGAMLRQLPGMSSARAQAVLRSYPNPHSMMRSLANDRPGDDTLHDPSERHSLTKPLRARLARMMGGPQHPAWAAYDPNESQSEKKKGQAGGEQ